MSRTKTQALVTALQQHTVALPLADKPAPIERVSGAVDGGPALVVKNLSTAHNSTGIEVKVGKQDAEVRNFALSATADQLGGIGVIGRGDYGVVGQSPDNVGVMGFGTTGLFGFSNDPAGRGVEGHTSSPSGIGVLASAPDPQITALAIDNGNIRVLGAGENTPTPLFIHIATQENTRGTQTIIDHPMTNNDPNAMLIVTRRGETITGVTGSGGGIGNPRAGVSVAYNAIEAKWMLVQQGSEPLVVGSSFNVLVFKV
jgi:hypothetical protein